MNLANVYGNKYYFWIYEENTDSLVDFGSNDYKIRTEFRNRIKEKIRKGTLQLTQNNRWIIQDDMYIATSMKYESVYIGAWVSVSDYLLDLSKMKLSDSFRITLEDTQHQYVKSVDYSKAYGAILNNDSKLSQRDGDIIFQ